MNYVLSGQHGLIATLFFMTCLQLEKMSYLGRNVGRLAEESCVFFKSSFVVVVVVVYSAGTPTMPSEAAGAKGGTLRRRKGQHCSS